MAWLVIVLGYLLGSIPTAYIAGRISRGEDIRQIGDGNMGAQNAFRQLGPGTGVLVGSSMPPRAPPSFSSPSVPVCLKRRSS